MMANEDLITVNKSVLKTTLLAFEKSLAWQDFILSRLCLDLELVRQEVQCLVLDPDMLKAKSDLTDLFFPKNDFTPLLTDALYEQWTQEFEQRKTPISSYDKDFYRISLHTPYLPGNLDDEEGMETLH